MSEPMIIALIGATATIIAALIGAYAALRKDRAGFPEPPTDGVPPRNRRGIYILVAGIVLAGIVLVAGYAFGKAETAREVQAKQLRDVTQRTQSYAQLVSQGIGAGKLYVLPSVVMLVSVERSDDGKHQLRSTHCLRSAGIVRYRFIQKRECLRRGYHSDYPIERIPGADLEHDVEPNPDSKTWQVLLDALNDGQRHAVITATHVVMPITLKPLHDVHMFKRLGPTEDAYCYPNFDGDIIEELVIIIQSETLRFIPSQWWRWRRRNPACRHHNRQFSRNSLYLQQRRTGSASQWFRGSRI